MKRIVRVAVVVGTLLAAGAGRAAPEDAKRLFEEGTQLLAEKKYAEACVMLEASRKLEETIGTALYLGACYEAMSKWASAFAQFKSAERLAAARQDARDRVARARADRIEPKIAHLHLLVADEAGGVHVALDNVDLPRASWASVPVDPGRHALVATATGKKAWSTIVATPATAADTVVSVPALEDANDAAAQPVKPAATPGPTPAPVPAPTSAAQAPGADSAPPSPSRSGGLGAQQIAGIAVGGAGLVSMGIGSYFGLHAKKLEDDSSPHCRADDHCDATGGQLRGDAKSAAIVSTILFGVGGALVATGIVLLVTGHPAEARTALVVAPSAYPGWAGLVARGAF